MAAAQRTRGGVPVNDGLAARRKCVADRLYASDTRIIALRDARFDRRAHRRDALVDCGAHGGDARFDRRAQSHDTGCLAVRWTANGSEQLRI